MAIMRLDNIGVAVHDVERIAQFFETDLGLPTELNLAAEPPSAQVTVGAQYLYVFQVTASTSAALRQPALNTNPPGVDHLSFTVDNIDVTYSELLERGVVFDGPPVAEEAWGLRLAGFQDPEGNRYYLVQSMRAEDCR